MAAFDETTYGERIAAVYDRLYEDYEEAIPERLAEQAGDGPALELGIGTGRIALPLRRRGVEVHGIDASEAMVDRLRGKAGGDEIPVTIGSFAEIAGTGRFALIYVVFNTIFALTSQEEQVRCFASVAEHLLPGGRFVVEAFVPDVTRFTDGQTVRVTGLDEDEVRIDATMHDSVRQQITSQHIFLGTGGIQLYPVKLRYIWPSEMDLMAKMAGLEREARWGGWNREPFTAKSTRHISVYRRPE